MDLFFQPLVNKFEKSLDSIEAILKTLAAKVESLERKIGKNEKQFEACARGFFQVREACTTLREELSEASGTLIQSTYND